MALIISALLGLALMSAAGPTVAERAVLAERARLGQVSHVQVEFNANGLYKPHAAAGAPEPKPLDVKVETRFDWHERVLKVGPGGMTDQVVRRVNQAASAINGEVRRSAAALRPEVGLLVATRRDGDVVTFSPGGPLLRSELELVVGPGDPLTLPGLLPDQPVAVGDEWLIADSAARGLCDYEAIASSTLKGKLDSFDHATARIRLAGEVRGAARGGEGTITLKGSLTFDRKATLITRLELDRTEVRKPGPVEVGLDIKSSLSVERSAAEVPAELSDSALANLPLDLEPHRLLLLYTAPDGRYTLLHDRDWHVFWDDGRQSILKRLDHGEVVAQCNLAAGPQAGKGRHQDPEQFRADIKRALGARFGKFLGAGEVEGSGDIYRYKVAVQGQEGTLDVLWDYFLIANPEGDQLLATFTLGASHAKAFGDQDLQLVGSLEWKAQAQTTK
jgi:hypothetical protein